VTQVSKNCVFTVCLLGRASQNIKGIHRAARSCTPNGARDKDVVRDTGCAEHRKTFQAQYGAHRWKVCGGGGGPCRVLPGLLRLRRDLIGIVRDIEIDGGYREG